MALDSQRWPSRTAVDRDWKAEIGRVVAREDRQELLRLARTQTTKVLRYLISRLSSADGDEKRRSVRALGSVLADQELVSRQRATELLRRFFWALNDESGAVPYGVPEAIGEILAVRPELQAEFLPLLCSVVTDEEMSQTGSIERGVFWALGRIGQPVAQCSTEAVQSLTKAAHTHPDEASRRTAAWALGQLGRTPPGTVTA